MQRTQTRENGPVIGTNKSPEINLKETGVYELPGKEFKITIIKMLKDLRRSIHERNENLNKEKI